LNKLRRNIAPAMEIIEPTFSNVNTDNGFGARLENIEWHDYMRLYHIVS
jgi:hypothetical protein